MTKRKTLRNATDKVNNTPTESIADTEFSAEFKNVDALNELLEIEENKHGKKQKKDQ